jgi:tetratricopeptide (TPR) repeat protein
MVLLRKRAGLAVFTLLVEFAPVNVARADTPPADKATADALFDEGHRLLAEGRAAEACPKLEESQRLDPATGTALNLGDCLEKIGRAASAYVAFGDAATLARRVGDNARAEEAERRAEALQPKLVRLAVNVPEASRFKGLAVSRDGQPLPPTQWGMPVPVDPGDHVVEATAPGRTPWRKTVPLTIPGTAHVTVPPLAEVQHPPPRGRAVQRVVGIAVGSAGLAALGVGIGFAVAAATTDSESKKYCLPEDSNKCYAKGVALRNDAITYADTSTVVTSIGAVALATGVTLLILARSSRPPEKPARAWVLVSHASPQGAGLAFDAIF